MGRRDHIKKSGTRIFSCLIAASIALTGCAKAPDSEAALDAVSLAAAAEAPGRLFSSLPDNKSIATNMEGGRQLVIARKVGNLPDRPDCAIFDITVSRPSSRGAFFGDGDSGWKQGVTVCAPN